MKITFRCVPGMDSVLPRPVPARQGLPDWLKEMPLNTFSAAFDQPVETVKKCPPFIDAMTAGFLMPLACDVHVDKGRFRWDWDDLPEATPSHTPRTPVSVHISDQVVNKGSIYRDGLFALMRRHVGDDPPARICGHGHKKQYALP